MTVKKEHWLTHSKIYRLFTQIRHRCNGPQAKNYDNYWWRWIRCERESFEDFYRDMWSTYKEWLSIDRIDNNWNYCKENCRRATNKEQADNRRSNVEIEYNGLKMNLINRANYLWVKRNLIINRLDKWRPPHIALSMCTSYRRPKVKL